MHYNTLQVGDIIVANRGTSVGVSHGHRRAAGVVGKVQRVAALGHLGQAAAVVHIGVGICTVGAPGAQTVAVVGVGPGAGAVRKACQLPTVFPGVGPGSVAGHIADGIIGKGLVIDTGQQVFPVAIIIANRSFSVVGIAISAIPTGCLFRVYFVCSEGDKRTSPCPLTSYVYV